MNESYEVKVIKMLDFGAVVEYTEAPGNEVLLHVSELAWERTENVTDVVNMGDVFMVKYLGVDSVYLVGHSRGGGLAILTAAISPYVKGLATWSAISDFSNLWKKDDEKDWRKNGKIEIINARTKKKMHLNLALLEDFENNKDELDIVAAAKKINVPWLILHGEDDVSVPIDAALVLGGANMNSRLIKIANADHVYGAMHPFVGETLTPQLIEVGEKTLKFFKSIEFG